MNQQQTTFDPSKLNQNNFTNYLIQNALQSINTTFPARIVSINGLRATIEPIINSIGAGQDSPGSFQINDIPIAQLIGGHSGIIIEYKPDDVVLCGVVQRDISLIKQNWQRANPPSNRVMNYADSIILFKLSNQLPTTFVKITDAGITIHTDNNVTISCNNAEIDATNVTINGNTATNGQTTLGGGGGGAVLTQNTIINDSQGKPCTIVSGAATKVTAL